MRKKTNILILGIKVLALTFIVSLIFTGCLTKEQSQSIKPNIVIILSDDQGWGDLSLSGNTNLQTPNIDKLASEGVTFNNFYVCPVCSPTRAEMLTGRYHVRGGVFGTSLGGERLDLDETTIADVFKNAGYQTAAYGKWHNGMQYPYHPNGRGFDDYYGFCSGHWGNYFNPMLEHNGELVTGNGYITDDFTDHGLQFMEQNKDKPFFLYLPFNTPHRPMQVPDKWWDKFTDKELELKASIAEREDEPYTKAALAMCENIDWNVGRILNKIEELGIEDNTIVLYFSDNGPNSWRWNGRMKGIKGSTDEGGVRSPLVMKWPGKIEKGNRIEQISGAIDLLPTLADLAEIDLQIKKPLDGISLKPLLLEDNPNWNDRFLFTYWKDKLSTRNQKYRLDNNGAVFDIENDRAQVNNLSSEIPQIMNQMLEAAEKFKNEVLIELPVKDERLLPLGHPDTKFTQIPARDGIAHGNIERSNRSPNCTFFTNWISLDDKIVWDVEIVEEGNFEIVLYYTCPEGDEGSSFELSMGNDKLIGQITESFNPPLTGMENDRVFRGNSYIKEFKPLKLGKIHAEKGKIELTLKALEIPGKSVMDVRLLMFERVI
ncbi:MAG: arylsulfatase [Prolixibacteraceae bacterium]|jgi:arylsulfatase A-like enzyme|nr:arylsulfatase [Prolixibacteraceae bacterium]MBT6764572.1 arylsulfatase [Prolixibacteraceae bacterium]MBT6998660.1 arylsulfatase [Prolixibacteraceae bacterium]MBT7397461.1 arylsulfatase [Prolixibacteraceae bacterium]